MHNSIELRKGKESQLPEIFELYTSAIAHMDSCGLHFWDFNWYPNKQILENDVRHGNLYAAVDSEIGRIAGCIVLSTECDEQYMNGDWHYTEEPHLIVHRLCMHPDFEGKGFATKIMQNTFTFAIEHNYRNIRLDAFSGNPASLHLYEKLGFRRAGTAHWTKGTFFLLEKNLVSNIVRD